MDADHPADFPVAPNLDNTFGPLIKRLPLGRSARSPLRSSFFRVWVPTEAGGKLTVRHTAGGTVELQRPLGTPISPRKRVVEHVIKDELNTEYGWYYVKAVGAPVEVDCTFQQVGFAREGPSDDDAPLIPYNFWFWPTAQKATLGGGMVEDNKFVKQAVDVLARYCKITGQNGTSAGMWEAIKHQKPEGMGWEGHCHHAAPASILFHAPASKVIEGVAFDKEEIEYLATEFFGNFGGYRLVWHLDVLAPPLRFPLIAYLKPGLPKTREDLIRGLSPEIGETAAGLVDLWIKDFSGMEEILERSFAKAARTFYGKLVNQMLRRKHPLMANMRAYDGHSGPEEVWNQALFWYEATFREADPIEIPGAPPVEAERVIEVTCRLFANEDKYPSTGLPGYVKNNETIPYHDKVHPSLLYVYTWRFVFDDRGMVADDPRGAWLHARNAFDEEIFPPTYLAVVDAPQPERRPEIPGYETMVGNPMVGRELLSLGLIQMRKRYQ